MKILRVCPAPPHIDDIRNNHNLNDKLFDEQIAIFRSQNILLPGGWGPAMGAEGFDVFETVYDDISLQLQWAREDGALCGGIKARSKCGKLDILKSQVKKFRPDIIFLYSGALFSVTRAIRDDLRNFLGTKVIITGFWGDELPHTYNYKDYFGGLDFIFCSSPNYKRKFDETNITAHVIGNCFDDSIPYRQNLKKAHDFVFCGVTGFGYPDHIGRYEKLSKLMSRSELKIWTNETQIPHLNRNPAKYYVLDVLAKLPPPFTRCLGALGPRAKRAVEIATQMRDTGITARPFYSRLSHPQGDYFDDRKSLKQIFPERVSQSLPDASDYYELLSQSRLVLNLHRDEEADVGNIRCFEVTGLGSCLITDRGTGLQTYFDGDNEIVTFETVDECLDKVAYLLDHQDEIERIAKNGQRATLARHTVKHRCQEISSILKQAVLMKN